MYLVINIIKPFFFDFLGMRCQNGGKKKANNIVE